MRTIKQPRSKTPRAHQVDQAPAPAGASARSATAQANVKGRKCPVCGEKSQDFVKVGLGIFEKDICLGCAQTGQKIASVLGRIFG